MPTISELILTSGASESTLCFLRKYGLQFDYEDFEIDKSHRKAVADLRARRLSPYVLAYAWRCKIDGTEDDLARYDSIGAIAKIRGFSIHEAFSDIRAKQIESELYPTAKHWIDRAIKVDRDFDAYERLSRWCKAVLKAAPPFEVDHTYLAVRLLISLSRQDMFDYPRPVQRALNRTRHYGFLDGWWSTVKDEAGKNTVRYSRPKYDL